jgi:hypothetical protein
VIVRHHRTEVDDAIFVQRDPVKVRDAGYVDERIDVFAHTAF